jgi:hypothetical protein
VELRGSSSGAIFSESELYQTRTKSEFYIVIFKGLSCSKYAGAMARGRKTEDRMAGKHVGGDAGERGVGERRGSDDEPEMARRRQAGNIEVVEFSEKVSMNG